MRQAPYGRPTIDTYLEVKWSVSRGRDTYGYNICAVVDTTTGKRYRCSGGGYDLLGTSFGQWLSDVHSARLEGLVPHQERTYRADGSYESQRELPHGFYGLTHRIAPSTLGDGAHWRTVTVSVDGGCGLQSMLRIAEAAGLIIKTPVDHKGNVTGFVVSETVESEVTTV